RLAVQNPMIRYAKSVGWEYVRPEDALTLRGGDTGLYFTGILEAQLLRLNLGVLDTGRAADTIRRLNLLKPSIEGNRDALSWVEGEQSVFVQVQNRERNVWLIDFTDPDNNQFHVTDEWWHRGVVYRNRADAVFLVNGIPVAIAETKAATKQQGIAEAVDQI